MHNCMMSDAKRFGSAAVVAGLFAGGASAQVTLTEVTDEVGLTATHDVVEDVYGGEWVHTAGMAVGDFNRDGHLDLFWISGGTTPDRLFINDGDGTFTDMAVAWGLGEAHCGGGASVGDFNGDGWPDIYVTSFGVATDKAGSPGQHRLYRNNGDETFTNISVAAGVNFGSTVNATGSTPGWGDYDMDGDLDLMVASWNIEGDSNINRLYLNNGDETFTDVTAAALGTGLEDVRGFTPNFIDMDGDLYPELLLAADAEQSRYFVNNHDGTFTNVTGASGTGLDDNGMGQTIGDFNNDNRFDWYVTSIFRDDPFEGNNPGNMLYMKIGPHIYDEMALESGALDGGWGWGVAAVDLDHDTWTDIVEVNGWNGVQFLGEMGYLFHNNGDGTFTNIAAAAGFDTTEQGRGLVYFDADSDGDLDLAVANNSGPLQYYRNDTTHKKGFGHWLRVSLDTSTNELLAPDGAGSLVVANVVDQEYHQFMDSRNSYLASSEHVLHFGLGHTNGVNELRVHWPRGYVTTLDFVLANQHITIVAPELADVDADGTVSTTDLLGVLGAWGPVENPEALRFDMDNDGTVGTTDLLIVLGSWG